ncbi:Heparan sulfate glucosamine 3-O-sulfotransferase 6 (Heparan sulfate D-glucosaminyl 3-O-sulfotransferase 6) (3-OST-6) (Heparan sulfate 3-O-sulfotransferase 6) (h3-OST-6), partial [Durusdinium trenchii]
DRLDWFDARAGNADNLAWYASRFAPFQDAGAIGEDSTTYLLSESAPPRIKALLPEVKLIFLLRDPVKRAHSQYWHLMRTARLACSFEEALTRHSSIILGSTYAPALKRYLDLFGPDQVHIAVFEDFLKDQQGFVDTMTDYIGVPRMSLETAETWFNRTLYPRNPGLLRLANRVGSRIVRRVSLLTAPQQITARAAFFHQPQPFYAGVAERFALRAERAVIVAHHPPFRGDGSLEYDPLRTVRLIDASFGVRPWWAPVSGVVRQQLRSFAPLIRLSSEDWVNRFDPENWQPGPPAFSNQTAIVGRHGRADPLKWPDRARDIEAPLDPGPDWQARVLGCPEAELRARGADPSAWDCVPFGSVPVQ